MAVYPSHVEHEHVHTPDVNEVDFYHFKGRWGTGFASCVTIFNMFPLYGLLSDSSCWTTTAASSRAVDFPAFSLCPYPKYALPATPGRPPPWELKILDQQLSSTHNPRYMVS